jgi:hypothetical protein
MGYTLHLDLAFQTSFPAAKEEITVLLRDVEIGEQMAR